MLVIPYFQVQPNIPHILPDYGSWFAEPEIGRPGSIRPVMETGVLSLVLATGPLSSLNTVMLQ